MSDRTKLVIRHLPPALPELVFWKTLSPWLDPIPNLNLDQEPSLPPRCVATFKSYVPGKVRQNKNKVDVPSRAYIQFATPEQVLEFHQGYAQQAFRDSKGNVTFPTVEFAPYQKTAGPPKKIDARIGTIEADAEFQAFMQRLNAPPTEEDPSPKEVVGESQKPDGPKTTPLIEHLRSVRKAAQEAALAAKQQRQSNSNNTSTHHPPGRTFSGQPQIMKRVVANTGPASSSTHNSNLASTHDQPPHLQSPAPSSSKAGKQNKASSFKPLTPAPQSAPTPSRQPAAPSLNKPTNSGQGGKPAKAKRPPRGVEDQPSQTSVPDARPKGPPSKTAKAPKSIVQPPRNPAIATDEVQGTSASGATQGAQKNPSMAFATEKVDPARGGANSSTRGKAPSVGRGGSGGSKKYGRGGKGGKANNNINPPASQPANPTTSSSTAIQAINHRPPQSVSADKPRTDDRTSNSRTDNSGEAAGARRKLGMALAGIAAKPERRKKSNPDNSAQTPPTVT